MPYTSTLEPIPAEDITPYFHSVFSLNKSDLVGFSVTGESAQVDKRYIGVCVCILVLSEELDENLG